jgi:hypothetical protein
MGAYIIEKWTRFCRNFKLSPSNDGAKPELAE